MNYAEKISDEIAKTLNMNGPLWSLWEEWCSQAFQQGHAIRAMLAMNRIKPKEIYLDMAKDWAVMTLRLQGTQGHPDRYNMGYGEQIKNGVPRSWFVADCGTLAVALLDVASFLPEKDKLRNEIIDSVKRFADYIIKNWTLKDGSFTLGYLNFEAQEKEPYHCANAQSNLFLWPLWKVTGDAIYREQALKATQWLASWTDYDCPYWGSPVHNRAYNCESLFTSLAHIDKNEKIYRKVVENIEKYIIRWATENFEKGWFKNGVPAHAKDPLLVMNLLLYKKYIKADPIVVNTAKKALKGIEKVLDKSFKSVEKHNVSGMALASNTSAARKDTDLFENILLNKFYVTDGLTGMAMVFSNDPDAMYPFSN
ncbi:MAG: hypothetical protein UT30_C0004G0011 [Candidatus Uhrbacteria bacterium GW2011_GWF2_39_13]|uniref:Uncharacterized protein n=1 Tax=Candidatus Uhrbacteria bacterium GW2011_GWF2_39_13 TaxID=1618995 RepID=A0A0G0MNM5_9BACT|nr:MAG: hypothetical protein UT30_C0004G0011 [Candidatus Uhrbacteria bacterium GW2011_GWF2_39_13]